jgi:hypothetical protein
MPFPVRFAISKPRISFFKDTALDFPETGFRQTCGNFIVTPEFRISRRDWQPFPVGLSVRALQSTGFALLGNPQKWGVSS